MFSSLARKRVHRCCQLIACVAVAATAHAQCERLPDGSWSCPQNRPARPTAMDVRIECSTALGSGTAIARLANGGTAIVTNYHVIEQQPRIVLHAGDGRSAVGKVLLTDEANDLALVAIADRWPIVTLGTDVSLGAAVQFRAFDRGQTFRKYTGRVVSEYSATQASTGDFANGYFATGRSVAGNSGGGVYSDRRLVGVVWGAPAGGTAFVRIGPLRNLLARIINPPSNYPPAPSSRPALPASPQPQPPPQCDCEERWVALDVRFRDLLKQPAPGEPPFAFDWKQIAAAALGVSSPIGLGIAIAGGLMGWRRKQKQQRGVGGPCDDGFRGENASE